MTHSPEQPLEPGESDPQTRVEIGYYLPEAYHGGDDTERKTYSVDTNNAGIGKILAVMDEVSGWGDE